MGRVTFFDFGPPFDYYELFLVRPTASGTQVERITLSPPAGECATAKFEIARAIIQESPTQLLGRVNPCALPERALERERKRRSKGLVFSGADIVMRVLCGGQTRLIRSDVLDRDMFDQAANTPAYTSWTMELLGKLDKDLGPGVMDKPIFPELQKEKALPGIQDTVALRDISEGKYDELFRGAPDKPSDLYLATLKTPPPPPSVQLLKSVPLAPLVFVLPDYPPLAKLAHVEGTVCAQIKIDPSGGVENLTFSCGPALLRQAVKAAAAGWRFSKDASGMSVVFTLAFALNCPKQTKMP